MNLSFCQTCGNRRSYAERTLPHNLQIASGWDGVEFILLDYGSTDGFVDFVRGLPRQHQIRCFRYETTGPFHMSHAKNLSHVLAAGRVVCNLDIDNFIHPDSIKELLQLKDNVVLHGLDPTPALRFVIGAKPLIMSNGSHGRISMTSATFTRLRGYDEKMTRMGHQDVDLLRRAKSCGMEVVRSNVPSPAINNPKDRGWSEMRRHNEQVGQDHGRIVNPTGFGQGVVSDLYGNRITAGAG